MAKGCGGVGDEGARVAGASGAWRTPDVWRIALSAFCADLGYQAVLAVFPLFFVLRLHAPVALLGLATAVAYGPGALAGYIGGRVGDRVGRKRTALWGNAFIPLLALIGLAVAPVEALVLLALGWWARNFRSAPRRAMLTEVVAPADRGKAFGFLHALDIGGGTLAAVYAFALVALLAAPYRLILLLTLVPLIASTVVLAFVRAGGRPATAFAGAPPATAAPPKARDMAVYRGVLLATALYGFSSYSAGFPILTIAQGTHSPAKGVLSYVLFLGVSALTGLWAGRRWGDSVRGLALAGYGVAALGSAGIAVSYALHLGVAGLYASMAILGFALGVVETLEPTLISRLAPAAKTSGGMGSLTASRSMGLFVANIALGLLYHFSPVYSYAYATAVAAAAVVVLLGVRARVGRLAAG